MNTVTNNTRTLTDFAAFADGVGGMNQELATDIIERLGGYDSFAEQAEDIASHGMASGFSGLIYYHETAEVYQKYTKAINDYLETLAINMGVLTDDEIDRLMLDGFFDKKHINIAYLTSTFNPIKNQGFGIDDCLMVQLSEDTNHDAYQTYSNTVVWAMAEELAYLHEHYLEEYGD